MMLGFLILLVGMITFISVHSHILMMLLSLEFSMLGLFFMLSLAVSLNMGEVYLILVFLIFMVCEGALGLSLVVLLNRVYGNDFMMSLSLLEC